MVIRSEGLRHSFNPANPGQYLLEVDKLRNYFQDYFETEEAIDEFNLVNWVPVDLECENNDELEQLFLNYYKKKVGGEKVKVDEKNRVCYFGPFVEWMALYEP